MFTKSLAHPIISIPLVTFSADDGLHHISLKFSENKFKITLVTILKKNSN